MRLPGPVHMEVWFTRSGSDIIRTEVFQAYDGSVVAYQDCVNGEWKPLYMERQFLALNAGEADFQAILEWSGVLDASKIQLFDCGR